jgi:hypothetical protein
MTESPKQVFQTIPKNKIYFFLGITLLKIRCFQNFLLELSEYRLRKVSSQ